MKDFSVQHVNVTSPVKKESEDAFILNGEACVFGVLDGATPLVPFEDENGHNGAYLAAQLFKEQFESINHEASLIKTVEKANERLRSRMKHYHINMEKGEERWSTCVAVVKLTQNRMEYVQLGDSMIIVGYEDHSCKVITKDTVKGISARSKKKREEDREKGYEIPEEKFYRDHLQNLRYNRGMANVKGGYSVANGMPEVMNHIDYGSFSLEGITDILIFTDGLFHPEMTLEESYRSVKEDGIDTYMKRLYEYLKKHTLHIDDRTAVYLQKK